MTNWIDIAALQDIPRRGGRVVKTRQGCIAVFRTHDERVFALDDACPHKKGPLSEGFVHGAAVTCPLHNWVIDLETGAVRGEDKGSVATHDIRIEHGRIFLDASRLTSRKAA